MAEVSFDSFALEGFEGAPTALQWGPDGRLYVAERTGRIGVYEVEKIGGAYRVEAASAIDAVRAMPNRDDDGSLAGPDDDGVAALGAADPDGLAANQRQVLGLAVGGTAEAPVLYVTSSDPRIGAGGGGADTGLDTNSGVLSRLTLDPATGRWTKVDLVRGLPRSEENHASNGLALAPDGRTLYLAQGGHTNAGAPSNNFAGQAEYAYSAAILKIDLAALDAIAAADGPKLDRVPGFAPQAYVLDLPTLDDPTRAGDGDAGDPFGGNDGLNQAKLTRAVSLADGTAVPNPVTVHSPGYRNPYDVLLTRDGHLYTYDNGANRTWGGLPLNAAGGEFEGRRGEVATNAPNENQFGQVLNADQLHLVDGPGYYGGHPNPVRAFGAEAGLWSAPRAGTTGAAPLAGANLPADWGGVVPPGLLNPEEGLYAEGGFRDGALDSGFGSVNGLAEYTSATAFGGALDGALLATDYNGELYAIRRNPDGTVLTATRPDGRIVADPSVKQVIPLGDGGGPLGIDALGDGGPFPGTIWVANLKGGAVRVLEPSGGGPPPPDGDLDDDGLGDARDAFALDATNGAGVTLGPGATRLYDFEGGAGFPGTLGGIGFTGAMTDGATPFRDGDAFGGAGLYGGDNLILGGAGGTLQIKAVGPGDALGDADAQRDALQLGLRLGAGVGVATFTVTLDNWLLDDAGETVPLGGAPSAGLFVGTGGQDDYVKLVLGGRTGPGGEAAFFARLAEARGAVTAQARVDAGGPGGTALLDQADPADEVDWVQLRLAVDVASGEIQGLARFGRDAERDPSGGLPGEVASPFAAIGAPVALAAGDPLLAAVRGTYAIDGVASGLAVGVIGTSAGGTPFTVNYDGLEVATAAAAGGPAGAARLLVTPGGNINASTYAAGSVRLTNTGGRRIERVEIDISTAALPDLAFAPTAAVGDTTAKPFTVDDAGGTGLLTPSGATGAPPFGGGTADAGYTRLGLDFAGFDPGETLAFSVDMDPRSVDGHTGSGAGGAVSGVDLTGATVTVRFADGTVAAAQVMADGSLAGGEAYVGAARAPAVALEVGGIGNGERGVLAEGAPAVARLTGTAGAAVRLVVVEGAIEGVGGAVPTPSNPVFDANVARAVTYFDVTLGADGRAAVDLGAALGDAAAVGRRYVLAAAELAGLDPSLPGLEAAGSVAPPVVLRRAVAGAPTHTDTGGDRLDDLLVKAPGAGGAHRALELDGAGAAAFELGRGTLTLRGAGDLDGDAGRELVFKAAGGGAYTAVDRDDGTSVRLGLGGLDLLGLGDLDADGRDELVMRREAGSLVAVDARTLAADGLGLRGFEVAAVGDLAGDGRADLLVRRAPGAAWQVVEGGAGAPTTLAAGSEAFLALADFDGDGSAEALFRTAAGGHVVRDASGGGPASVAIGLAGMTPMAAADLDGDGDTDLLAGDPGTGARAIYDLDTRILDPVPALAGLAAAAVGNFRGLGAQELLLRDGAGAFLLYDHLAGSLEAVAGASLAARMPDPLEPGGGLLLIA